MKFEKSLECIVDRAQLIEHIRALPAHAKGTLLIDLGDTSEFHHVGEITVAESCFLATCFLHWLTEADAADEEESEHDQ